MSGRECIHVNVIHTHNAMRWREKIDWINYIVHSVHEMKQKKTEEKKETWRIEFGWTQLGYVRLQRM